MTKKKKKFTRQDKNETYSSMYSDLQGSIEYYGKLTEKNNYTLEEEAALIIKAQNGDERAKEKIIRCHIKLVFNILKKYNNALNIDKEDLLQAGMAGMAKAMDKFNTSKGFRFSTYATWWIHNFIRREKQASSDMIRLPVSVDDIILKMLQLKKNKGIELLEENAEIIAKELDIKTKRIEEVLDYYHRKLHMRMCDPVTPQTEIENNNYSAMLAAKDEKPQSDAYDLFDEGFNELLSYLTILEREIIKDYYGIGRGFKTTKETAERLGVTIHKANRLRGDALKKLEAVPISYHLLSELNELDE